MHNVVKLYSEGLLKEHLDYELSEEECEAFYSLCRQSNSDLMRHSLKEMKGFASAAKKSKAEGKPVKPFLPKLTRIYFRKLEEQARLFTALSIFETAYRVHLATWMEDYYGVREWWTPVHDVLLSGGPCTQINNINGVPLLPAVANAIERLLKGIDGYDLKGKTISKQNSGHSLLSFSKLSDLEELIKEQWVHFKPSLAGHNPALTALASFSAVFKRIREARNSCFHHRETADRQGLLRVIESMLDLLNVHLETASLNARMAAVKPATCTVQWHERHNFGLLGSSAYEIELHFEDETKSSTINGRDKFEAIQRAIDSINADDRIKLQGVKVDSKTTEILIVEESIVDH